MELPRRTWGLLRTRTRAAWRCTRRRTAPTLLAAGNMLCRVAATADTDQATARCSTTGARRRCPRRPSWATYFYGDAGMLYAVHNVHTDAAVFKMPGFDFRVSCAPWRPSPFGRRRRRRFNSSRRQGRLHGPRGARHRRRVARRRVRRRRVDEGAYVAGATARCTKSTLI